MARIMIAAVVALLLFGSVIAADESLTNPDVQSSDNATADQQVAFAEATTPMIEAGAPVVLFALVIGTILAAVRAVR
jgi:hypothetical protein